MHGLLAVDPVGRLEIAVEEPGHVVVELDDGVLAEVDADSRRWRSPSAATADDQLWCAAAGLACIAWKLSGPPGKFMSHQPVMFSAATSIWA